MGGNVCVHAHEGKKHQSNNTYVSIVQDEFFTPVLPIIQSNAEIDISCGYIH